MNKLEERMQVFQEMNRINDCNGGMQRMNAKNELKV